MSVKQCQRSECYNLITSTERRAKYCSRSCAAQVNNVLFPKRLKQTPTCESCGSLISRSSKGNCMSCYLKIATPPNRKETATSRFYEERQCDNCSTTFKPKQGTEKCCSHRCASLQQHKLRKAIRIDQWLKSEWTGGTVTSLSNIIRNYLLEQSEFRCARCGFSAFHPDDGKTILEINHIDGDGTNHAPSNLEVLCPNCHALTSSYKARNIGKGRPQHYIRVRK